MELTALFSSVFRINMCCIKSFNNHIAGTKSESDHTNRAVGWTAMCCHYVYRTVMEVRATRSRVPIVKKLSRDRQNCH